MAKTSFISAILLSAVPLAAAEPVVQLPSSVAWLLGATAVGCLGAAVAAITMLARQRRQVRADADEAELVRNLVHLAQGYFAFRLHLLDDGRVTVVSASPALAEILGHPASWYQADFGRFIAQVCSEDRYRVQALLSKGERCTRPSRLSFRIDHPGHPRPRSLTVHALPGRSGDRALLDGICIDLTEESEAEAERLRLIQQLEIAQRHESLGLLAGGVAHDFNNLLGAIRGNAELLQPMLTPTEQVRLRWDRLMLAVDRASGLVRQILAYTGKGTIEQKPLELEREIRQLKALMKHGLPPQIRIQLEVQGGLPTVLFDPVQFQQVLLNLIMNAAESYQGRPGTVTVALDRYDAERLRLRVIDEGCGIDEATKARMFEPYFTTKDKGHGLGLAAVQGIIRKVGGDLLCDSAPGKGTTFTVVLKASDLKRISSRVQSVRERPRGKGAILVIDDDDLMRDATGAMLENLGYSTRQAAGGVNGLELLRVNRKEISAVVLDCRMPDLDGVTVLHRLRDAKDRIPVILTSGMTAGADLSGELSDARTRFLPKPFTQSQLSQTLAAMFEGGDADSDSDYTAIREFVRRQGWKSDAKSASPDAK